MKRILFWLIFLICCPALALTNEKILLDKSQQIIIVITKNHQTIQGRLYRFSRKTNQTAWQLIKENMPVVIGKNGMSNHLLFNRMNSNRLKKEGDNLTPMGIFAIGPNFGFAKDKTYKITYFHITPTSICVDDSHSVYYNQLIYSEKIRKKDWSSAEKMREIMQYQWGSFVQYNKNPTKPNQGSCIFLHSWQDKTQGTAGCIAMNNQELKKILHWLDEKKQPVLAIFTQKIYKKIQKNWQLPFIYT